MSTSKVGKSTSPTAKAKLTRIVGRITSDSQDQELLLRDFYFGDRDSQEELFKAILWGRVVTPQMEEAKEAYFQLRRQHD